MPSSPRIEAHLHGLADSAAATIGRVLGRLMQHAARGGTGHARCCLSYSSIPWPTMPAPLVPSNSTSGTATIRQTCRAISLLALLALVAPRRVEGLLGAQFGSPGHYGYGRGRRQRRRFTMTDDPGRRYWPESAIRHVECIAWSLWLPRSSRNLAPPLAVTASSRSARAMRSAVAGTDDPCMNLAPKRNSRGAQPASRPARPAAIAPTDVAALASPRRRVTQRRSGGAIA